MELTAWSELGLDTSAAFKRLASPSFLYLLHISVQAIDVIPCSAHQEIIYDLLLALRKGWKDWEGRRESIGRL